MSTSLNSVCTLCRFRLARPILTSTSTAPTKTQVRGKKKNAKPVTSIEVRLVKDLPGYGRKGSIVPVPIGQMRNYFYPHRFADYVGWTEARALKKTGFVASRDFGFKKSQSDDGPGAEIKEIKTTTIQQPARMTNTPQPVRVDLNRTPPAEAFNMLSRILPPAINFYRAPIDTAATETGKTPQPLATPNTAGPWSSMFPDRTNSIYGSVSTGDIATNLKAIVGASEEAGGRIVLGDEDIRFTSGTDDQTRAKQLGDFDIEIRIKGHDTPIRRQIRVLAEELAPVDREVGDRAVEELAAQQPMKDDMPDEYLIQEAEADEKIEGVQATVDETRQLLDDLVTELDDRKMTPAEAMENEPASQVETEGIVLEEADDQSTPQSKMDEAIDRQGP